MGRLKSISEVESRAKRSYPGPAHPAPRHFLKGQNMKRPSEYLIVKPDKDKSGCLEIVADGFDDLKSAEKGLKEGGDKGEFWIVAGRRKVKLAVETKKIVKFEAVE